MSNTGPVTCCVNSTRIMPCTALGNAIEDGSTSQRTRLTLEDVVKFGVVNVRTGHFLILRSGDYRRQGICLNHCPFCGTDLTLARSRVGKKESNVGP